jgi:formylglycine-generating enzyme required for sulfatase activity
VRLFGKIRMLAVAGALLILGACHGDPAIPGGGRPEERLVPKGCALPYSAPGTRTLTDELGDEYLVPEVHVRCRIEFEDLRAEVLVKAEPTGVAVTHFEYRAKEACACRGGELEILPAGMFWFKMLHHRWMEMEVALDGRRFVFGWSGVCKGARPCTPDFDRFDVRRLDDGSLLAEAVPTVCAEVGPNGIPLPLVPQVRVPPEGDLLPFTMGSDTGDADERPVHTFIIRPVRMDVREATNLDYAAFLNDHGNDCDGHACVDLPGAGSGILEDDGAFRPEHGLENHPVVQVSWYGAQAYCQWRRMRLPHESDWEIAASALGQRRYPWGDREPDCDLARFGSCGQAGPEAVCSRAAGNSREGICNLADNVSEWIGGGYREDFYESCCRDYLCTTAPDLPQDSLRAVRGGSFVRPAPALRAAHRGSADPETFAADLGFRCVSNNPTSWAPCEDDAARPKPETGECIDP